MCTNCQSDRTALDIATSPECKGHLQAAVDAAVAKETDRLARIAAEEERVRIEQEAIAEAMEVERQRDAAERAEEARALALQERIAREADMAREAARAKKKAEAEARALEHARILAEKAAAKNRRRMEMEEDYYSEEEAVAADTNTDTDEHRSCVVDTPVGIKASDAGLGEAASHGLESGWAEDGPAVGDGHGGGSAEEDIAKAGGLETATDTC